jgi:hypothetical protein
MSPVYWASSAGLITATGSGLISELAVCKLAMAWLGADPAKLNDVTTITTSSQKEEVYCNSVFDTCRRAVLEDYNWQFAKRFQQLSLANAYSESGYSAATITGITKADPAVVTAAAHGFLDGWNVKISGVAGMTEINERIVRVDNKAAGTFECYGLNSTKFTTYASGGEAIRFEPMTDYQGGYAYRVPADLLRVISINPKCQFEIIGSGDDRRLLCPVENPIIEYVEDVTVVANMTNHFCRTWAARIAAELANPLQKKNAAMKDMWGHYNIVKNETHKSDGRNSSATDIVRDGSPTAEAGGWK